MHYKLECRINHWLCKHVGHLFVPFGVAWNLERRRCTRVGCNLVQKKTPMDKDWRIDLMQRGG